MNLKHILSALLCTFLIACDDQSSTSSTEVASPATPEADVQDPVPDIEPEVVEEVKPLTVVNNTNWIEMTDVEFAETYADMAFSDSLKDREIVAWMLFARTNQQIQYQDRTVPVWQAWATDEDTFNANPSFVFNETPRDDPIFVTNKDVLAGNTSTVDPDSANEEVSRNNIGYDYIVNTSGMNTYEGVLAYVKAGNTVDMPVGSLEIKASWLKATEEAPAPADAMTFTFDSGVYWFRGMHIMAKMRPVPQNLFYTEDPSWFWTTFEYNSNPGVQHVREDFITQRAPLSTEEITAILEAGGISGIGYEAYAPNGTQIRYTENANGSTAVILGHTDMEDFAGHPKPSDPEGWISFDASCHTCHATASINPETGVYFPFSVPTGALTPEYSASNGNGEPTYVLGDGFVPLDFMWPISFHAVPAQ